MVGYHANQREVYGLMEALFYTILVIFALITLVLAVLLREAARVLWSLFGGL